MGCAAAKPVVDRLEQQEQERLKVIRVNVQDPSGKQLADRLGMRYTPTFVLFDSSGSEVQRNLGFLDADAIRAWLDRTA